MENICICEKLLCSHSKIWFSMTSVATNEIKILKGLKSRAWTV